MPRRVSLPTADDLFRASRHTRDMRDTRAPVSAARRIAADHSEVSAPTKDDAAQGTRTVQAASTVQAAPTVRAAPKADEPLDAGAKKSSGRVRHDEKMTVYVTADELVDIELARLILRRHHGLAVDRGRLVREALALVLADLEARGTDSALVQRLLDE